MTTDKQPAGTFARLMSSGVPQPAAQEAQPTPSESPPPNVRVHARTDARTRARTHAPPAGDGNSGEDASFIEELYQSLQDKQHLASSTFRYRPEELRLLDRVFGDLRQRYGRKLSKNDLPRLGLAWLLEDYQRNKDKSVLAQVFARL